MEELVNLQNTDQVIWYAFAILLSFFLLVGVFVFGLWLSQRPPTLSPYSGMPLRRASSLSYYSAEQVLRYLHSYHQFDNKPFNLRKASFCRETGRVFSDCINWYDAIQVDWGFIQKKFPGNYVSWGSLTLKQKDAIRACHDSLEGFQTEFSSPNPSPRIVGPEYALAKPGPLYVDMETKILVGWKQVPRTELEVLIVQRPTKKVFL